MVANNTWDHLIEIHSEPSVLSGIRKTTLTINTGTENTETQKEVRVM